MGNHWLGRKHSEQTKRKLREIRTVHGMRGTKPYMSWIDMIRRCENPNRESYVRYGGRGIKVCEKWKTFEGFWADMGPTYKPGLTLDRKDNDGNYEPGNCQWATNDQQQNNKSRNRSITIGGVTKTIAEWSRLSGIGKTTLKWRLDRGWDSGSILNPIVSGGRKSHEMV